MNILIALIVGIAILAFILWAIPQFVPAELQYPVRLIAFVVFLIWIIIILWPFVRDLVTP